MKNISSFDNFVNEKKVYVGTINKKEGDKGPKSWAQDGIFKKYEDEEEANTAADKLKEEGKSVKIFTKKEYKEIEKIREQGQ